MDTYSDAHAIQQQEKMSNSKMIYTHTTYFPVETGFFQVSQNSHHIRKTPQLITMRTFIATQGNAKIGLDKTNTSFLQVTKQPLKCNHRKKIPSRQFLHHHII